MERKIDLTAFNYLSNELNQHLVTSKIIRFILKLNLEGRWELILHNGTSTGKGETTSNLNIIAYGKFFESK